MGDPTQMDERTKAENIRLGKTLCPRCEGTGNELLSMFRRCEACHGSGVLPKPAPVVGG